MTMTDPIADMLTRIRNAVRVRAAHVSMPSSRIKVNIARVLKDEGYIEDYSVGGEGVKAALDVTLKYGIEGESPIRQIRRESKPGCRLYRRVVEIPTVLNGLGIAIVSTPKGVLSDRACREQNVGGELLCTVY